MTNNNKLKERILEAIFIFLIFVARTIMILGAVIYIKEFAVPILETDILMGAFHTGLGIVVVESSIKPMFRFTEE